MGRKLMRVALDFDWPLKKLWKGYINPHDTPCPEDGKNCFAGSTAAAKWLDAAVRLIMLLGEEAADAPYAEQLRQRGRTYPHPYLTEWPQAPSIGIPNEVSKWIREADDNQREKDRRFTEAFQKYGGKLVPLTEQLRDLVERLSGEKIEPQMIGGSRGGWNVQKKLLELAGLDPEEWGTCQVCKGHGIHPDVLAAHEAWEDYDPPKGEGYQLWETTSEGSPASPVFKTLDELCEWCEVNATTFASFKATKEEWKKMLEEDFVCHQVGNAVFL